MKRSRFSEEQIIYALRQAECDTPIGNVCRQLGIAEQTFCAWKKKYAHLGTSELRRLRQLEEANSKAADQPSGEGRQRIMHLLAMRRIVKRVSALLTHRSTGDH